METRYITEFVHLAETLSFSDSSRQLHISQSSLSRHIQMLEKELDSPLFSRTTRKMELSAFGRYFLPYARKQAACSEESEKAVQRWQKKRSPVVTVGISHYAHLFDITESTAAFRKEFPDIPLHLVEKKLNDLHRDLMNGELNLITMAYDASGKLPERFIRAGESKLAAVIPLTDPLAMYNPVPLHRLSGQALLLPETDTLFTELILHALDREGVDPMILYEGSLKNRLEFLAQQPGIIIDEIRIASEQIKDGSFAIRPLEPSAGFVYGLEYTERMSFSEFRYMKFIRERFQR